jgi:hypothetical protein
MSQSKLKPFLISKHAVLEGWKRVKANQGAAGIDQESVEDFERKLKDNLYRIWNRMSSGSYLPPPVKTVSIPKAGGGERKLGIPTVADRVAQMVVKSAVWNLTSRKPKSFIARMMIEGGNTTTRSLPSWGMSFDRDERKIVEVNSSSASCLR